MDYKKSIDATIMDRIKVPMIYYLPSEIVGLIFGYDDTYKRIFSKIVIPDIDNRYKNLYSDIIMDLEDYFLNIAENEWNDRW